MLLTLSATSLASKLKPGLAGSTASKGGKGAAAASGGGGGNMTVVDIPKFAREQLDLHGMVLSTSLLQGADRALLQKIVESADKVGCPCLTLIESNPQPLGDPDKAGPAADRVMRVVQAAHWLGCNAVAIPIDCPDDDDAMGDVAEVLRPIVRKAEKMELNLCVTSGRGLTARPERITELLKKVGGFRIGTMPDFDSASACAGGVVAKVAATADAASADAVPEPKSKGAKTKAAPVSDHNAYLRRLVPYASTVLATVHQFEASKGKGAGPAHKPFDLLEYVRTVAAVGFDGALAIDFRGSGDPVEAITQARDTIRTIIGGGPELDEDDLDELDDIEVPEDAPAEKDDEA